MDDIVLRAKHWQVFPLALLLLLLMSLTVRNSTPLMDLINAVAYCLYFIWFAFIGNALFPLLPHDAEYSLTWFLLDTTFVAVACAAVVLLTENHSFYGEGLAALPVLYLFFALIHSFWFLGASLVATEKRRNPELGFYFGTMLLFLFWPVGVWWLQPRLNKVWHERQLQLVSSDKNGAAQ